MKRIIIKIVLFVFILMMFPQKVYAYDDTALKQNTEEIFEYLEGEESEIIETAEEIAAEGFNISISEIKERITEVFTQEVREQTGILKRLAAISILCGFIGSFGEAFGRKEVTDIGFFVCLITLIYMVIASIKLQCDFVYETVEKISTDVKIAMPAITAAAVSSGRMVSAPVMMPVMISFTAFTVFFTKNIALPFISASAILECINCISEKEFLSSLCQLIKKIISVMLKAAAFMFVSVISLQRLGTGNMSALAFKTARSAVGAVPVVGDIMKSSVETFSAVTSMINNSIAAAAAFLLFASCAVPVFKLSVMWLIYKLTAAFMEPVTDKRIVKALNNAGDISSALLALLFTVTVSYVLCMFIILLSF